MLAYSTEQNGCIIWRTKHVSSYEARATKLMYHILRGKWDETMAGASPILLCAARKPCKLLYWPSTKDSQCFPECFLQWSDCFQPVCLPAQQFLKLLEEVCSYGTRASRYLLLFLLYALSDIYTWVPDTWSGTRQVTVNIGWLEAFHVLFLWLLMNVFQFFVPWKGTALLIAPSMYNSHCTRMVGVDQLHFLTNWILEPTPVLSWRSSFLFHLRNGCAWTLATAAYVVNCYKFYLNHRSTIHTLQAFFSLSSPWCRKVNTRTACMYTLGVLI